MSATNPTCTSLGLNVGLRGERSRLTAGIKADAFFSYHFHDSTEWLNLFQARGRARGHIHTITGTIRYYLQVNEQYNMTLYGNTGFYAQNILNF